MHVNYILDIPETYKLEENPGNQTNSGWNKVHWDFFSFFVLPLLIFVTALVAYFGSQSESSERRDRNSK